MDGTAPAGWAGSEGDEEMQSVSGFAEASEAGSDAWIRDAFKDGVVSPGEEAGDLREGDVEVSDSDLEIESERPAVRPAGPEEITLSDTDENSSEVKIMSVEGGNNSTQDDSDEGDETQTPRFSFPRHSRKARSRSAAPAADYSAHERSHRNPSPMDLTNIPPDYPLPDTPRPFHLLNHAPMRNPGPPAGWSHPREMSVAERIEFEKREKARARRIEEQVKLREEGAEVWEWEWELQRGTGGRGDDVKGKGKEREEVPREGEDWHDVGFFPFADYSGLGYMRGVFAVCGGHELKLLRVPSASSSSSSGYETLATTTSSNTLPNSSHNREEYFTLAWSVNLTARPYTPMLAVAGRGRVVEVFLVGQKRDGSFILHHDRTISGHGNSIFHLSFHPTHPHLLASCSLDHTIRFVDATLPWGSNAAVLARVQAELDEAARKKGGVGGLNSLKEGSLLRRRRVAGELLAIANEDGHGQGVLSCDFHATQPLFVSCGMDGYIHLWRLPDTLLSATPSFPSTPTEPVFRQPARRPHIPPGFQPPSLPPPIFSSLAIHPGQWPLSVRFASRTSCLIFSSAPFLHDDARFAPRKSVKLWVPSILDVAASKVLQDRQNSLDEAFARLSTKDGPKFLDSGESKLFPPQPHGEGLKWESSSAFRVKGEAVVEGQACVGDRFGWYSPRAAEMADERGFDEPVLVFPTSTPTAKDGLSGDGLYFFRPFSSTKPASTASSSSSAVHPPLARATSHASTSSRSSTPMGSTQSQSTRLSIGVSCLSLVPSAPPPTRAQRLSMAAALFPPSRDRLAHEYHPRLSPTFIAPLPPLPASPPLQSNGENPDPAASRNAERAEMKRAEVVPGRDRQTPHFRGVAVDSEGAQMVLAVGEKGVISVWRRRRKGERRM
ncbi:hypothetical protein JCM6882_008879 [Rhodosporidiobolus microsporus]